MSYLLFRGLYSGVLGGLSPPDVFTTVDRERGLDFLADFRGPSIGTLRCTTGVEDVCCNILVRSPNMNWSGDEDEARQSSIGESFTGDFGGSKSCLYSLKSATRGSHEAELTLSSTAGISFGWTQASPKVQGQWGQWNHAGTSISDSDLGKRMIWFRCG